MTQAAKQIQCNIIMRKEFENNDLSCSLSYSRKEKQRLCGDSLLQVTKYFIVHFVHAWDAQAGKLADFNW